MSQQSSVAIVSGSDVSSARFVAVLGVTAVLFFFCLLPFELIPEIPVDIDSKPFFVPLALCALLPARRAGLAIGLGVALGEGLRDLMEGYELDDPIGFFGYIFGFWAASWIFAIAPRNRINLMFGAIVCAVIQSSIEATSFLLFGSEGVAVAIESAIGNTITHGVIWGAVPLLFLVPVLRGKFESHLGFEVRGVKPEALPKPPSGQALPGENVVAWIGGASFRYPGIAHPGVLNITLEVRRNEVLGVSGATPEGGKTLALLLAGLAPGATGGAFSGAFRAPESVSFVSRHASEYFTETRALHQVVAAGLLDGGEADKVYAHASALLSDLGLPEEKHNDYVWALTAQEQGVVLVAAAILRAPELIIADHLSGLFGPRTPEILQRLAASRREGGALIVLDDLSVDFDQMCDRVVSVDDLALVPDALRPVSIMIETPQAEAASDQVATAAPVQIPTLQNDRGGWWRRRDPRLKWAMFIGMILLIYIAPDWRWMAVMTGIGLLTMLTARPPIIWMAFALLVQVPNVIGLILLPVLGGEASTIEELGFGLRLGLGWVAAILFGISLLSTMEIPEMIAGLRGLGLPRRFAFVVGYAFVLIYLSMADFAQHVIPVRMKELFRWTRPWEFLKSVSDLFVPIVATVARRGGSMAIAIQTMGEGYGRPPVILRWTSVTDTILATITVAALVAAVLLRLGAL